MGDGPPHRDGRAPAPRPATPFVGRQRERAELGGGLEAALATNGSLYWLTGETGIGKTRLAREVADDAAARGAAVLWGAAWDAGGAPAFWPWMQAIRELLAASAEADLREDLGAGAAYVAQIVGDVRERVAGVAPAPALDSDAARFTAFDATANFLRAAAARRPLLIVLEDLHTADVPSIVLLGFLARGLHGARILLLATYREREAAGEVGEALAAARSAGRTIALRGLEPPEVGAMLAAQAERAAPEPLVRRVHALTEGNPLFVDEVTRLLVAEGGLDAAPGRIPLPDGVRDTIRRRLEPLSPAARATLAVAAVVGTRFGLEALVPAAGADRETVLEHLDEAVAAGLVELEDVGRYRFTHALVRETLYDDLPGRRRIELHAAVGAALVELRGDASDGPLSRLAHHFLQAAPGGDPAPAVEYATRAGDAAMVVLAYEQAADHYRGAMSALALLPPDAARRADLLERLGEALMRAGDLAGGREALHEAAAIARRTGDSEQQARAALASAAWGLSTGLVDEQHLTPLLEEALTRLDPGDSALRARVQSRLAAALYWSDDSALRTALAQDAIAMARRVGDPATLARVLGDAHLATWDPSSPVRSLPWAEEIGRLARGVGDPELAATAHWWRIGLLLELGDVETVDREIETFAGRVAPLHQPRADASVHLHRAMRASMSGRFDEAEARIAAATERAGPLLEQDAVLAMRLAGVAFVMRLAQGRAAELEPAVRTFAEAYPAMPAWRAALARVLVETGAEAELLREYERLAAGGFGAIRRDNLYLCALAFLTDVCAHVGDAEGARGLTELLAPYAGRHVMATDAAYLGPVDRYLGVLAATAGRPQEAAERFAAARDEARRLGARPVLEQLDRDEDRLAIPPPRRAPAGVTPARLARRGEVWEVGWGSRAFHVRDAKGLHHLARLLAEPGTELHALDLAGGRGTEGFAAGAGPAGPDLDDRAKAEYRQRIEDLREEIEEADDFADLERASRARDELDFLARELAAAVGLGGRDRPTGAPAERARVNVTRALKGAVDRMAREDEALGHHLRTSVRTGTFCCYEPGPQAPAWVVEA